MLTTPQPAFLYLPSRRTCIITCALFPSLFARYFPTLQRPQIPGQRGCVESEAAVDHEQP